MKTTPAQYAQYLLYVSETKTDAELDTALDAFVRVLQRDGMMPKVKDIFSRFSELWDTAHGIASVRVVSARKLSNSVIDVLDGYVTKRYQLKKVRRSFHVDPNVIGGVRIESKHEVVDATIQRKLRDMERFLKQE